MNKSLVFSAVAVIIVGAGSFWGGMKYQQSKIQSSFGNFGGRMMINGSGIRNNDNMRQIQRNQNFRSVNGEIIANDERSITVKMDDGSSRIILLSENTSLLKSSSGSKDDLIMGEKVMVMGTENSDGSVTDQNIQINPSARERN